AHSPEKSVHLQRSSAAAQRHMRQQAVANIELERAPRGVPELRGIHTGPIKLIASRSCSRDPSLAHGSSQLAHGNASKSSTPHVGRWLESKIRVQFPAMLAAREFPSQVGKEQFPAIQLDARGNASGHQVTNQQPIRVYSARCAKASQE